MQPASAGLLGFSAQKDRTHKEMYLFPSFLHHDLLKGNEDIINNKFLKIRF